MKILITAFDFPPQWGGVATYSWELAHSLHQLGHEVVIVTKERPGIPATDFEIIPISIKKNGLTSVPFLVTKFMTIIKTWKPDHIFCTLWAPGALAVYFAQKALGKKIPYSIAVHAMEIMESNETPLKRLRSKLSFLKKQCFRNAQYCFCVSRFTKELLLNSVLIDPAKVHVVNNGVSLKNFFRMPPENGRRYPILLTACRLMPNKGIDQVILALPHLIRTFSDLRYTVLGDGPDKERLIALAQSTGVENHVKFEGKVDQDTLIKHYQKSDLYVMLSRQEQHYVEGFGLVFLEAALCGTPSLGGNSGGIPDAIVDGVTGWLVDPNNKRKIEDKLLEILMDRQTLQKIGDQAYQHTLAHRSWQRVAEQILKQIET